MLAVIGASGTVDDPFVLILKIVNEFATTKNVSLPTHMRKNGIIVKLVE